MYPQVPHCRATEAPLWHSGTTIDFSTAPPSPRAPPPPPPFSSPRTLPPPVFDALYDYANFSLGPEQRPGSGVPTYTEAP